MQGSGSAGTARLPSSPPHRPLPEHTALCWGGGPRSPHLAPLALCSPDRCTWVGGGGGRRRALRCPSLLLCLGTRTGAASLSPLCRLAKPHRIGAASARGSRSLSSTAATLGNTDATGADWRSWERTPSPTERCRCPPARAAPPRPWHVGHKRSLGGTGPALPAAAMVGAGSRR